MNMMGLLEYSANQRALYSELHWHKVSEVSVYDVQAGRGSSAFQWAYILNVSYVTCSTCSIGVT